MDPQSQAHVELFRLVARRLASLSERDLGDLLSGDATLDIRVKRRSGKKEGGGSRRTASVADAVKRLQTMRSREAGLAYLDELNTPRPWLEDLARALDLPVQRSDSVDRLRVKAIEATIGYRLRSQAVHGRESEQLPLDDSRVEPPEVGTPADDIRPITPRD